MAKYAVTMPGKLGDCLYALSSCRYLAEKSGQPVDFYTSEYCSPLRELFEYQSCIDKFIISEEYKAERFDMGVQPYVVPTPWGMYETVFHLGFRSIPNKRLDWFMAESIGIDPTELPEIKYEHPEYLRDKLYDDEKIIILAARGETGYKSLFLDFMGLAVTSGYIVYQIGSQGEFIGWSGIDSVDCTGWHLLNTAMLLSLKNVCGFVGLMSSQLVLANGWSWPKIAPHNGKSWDMRHVVKSPSNFYPIDPTAQEIMEIIKNGK